MSSYEIIDEKDAKIIEYLQDDARASYRQISKELGISITSLISRIKKLEKKGIIKGYVALIDYSKLGFDFPVLIDIRIAKGKLLEVEKEIARHPNVLAVYDITGEFDVTVLAIFKNRKELDSFVKKLQQIEYVERTNTKLILNTIKDERKIKLL
ncbi:MAG: Lrp/AsnC family transcriptional regulator [Candidatus Asgardarchaeia archaeon]